MIFVWKNGMFYIETSNLCAVYNTHYTNKAALSLCRKPLALAMITACYVETCCSSFWKFLMPNWGALVRLGHMMKNGAESCVWTVWTVWTRGMRYDCHCCIVPGCTLPPAQHGTDCGNCSRAGTRHWVNIATFVRWPQCNNVMYLC